MPSVNLRVTEFYDRQNVTTPNPLPQLLKTPSGLAIVEIQGTIHAPVPTSESNTPLGGSATSIPIGRLEFPLYDTNEPNEGKWMKKVYLYVGKHQRLTGEVKKLAKPLGVIRKVSADNEVAGDEETIKHSNDDLELVDVVKYKLLFSARPEPVGE